MNRKAEILLQLEAAGFPENDFVLTLDEFFKDNEAFFNSAQGYAAIGVNLPDPPPPMEFYNILNELIQKGYAEQVFVQITDADEPESWFFSDTVYIVSNLVDEEIAEAVETLGPDEVTCGWVGKLPVNIDPSWAEKNVYTLWWD
jgi:hypothetical protein